MAPGVVDPAPAVDRSLTRALAAVTDDYDDTLRFFLNGTKIVLDTADPEVTLLEYLRGIGLTGTKVGCGQGGCGACTVMLSQRDPVTSTPVHRAVNSCLRPLCAVDGMMVTTTEGIGSVHDHDQRVLELESLERVANKHLDEDR